MIDVDGQEQSGFPCGEYNKGCYVFVAAAIGGLGVGGAILGGSALAAGASIFGASKAADAQTAAAQKAQDTALHMYDTTRGDLAPYRAIGQDAGNRLGSQLTDLTAPVSVNPQDFVNSDMYKFQAYQGEKAAENSAAARGLGSSGAALKASALFADNLAKGNWQQNFENQQTNKTNAFNRLSALVNTGENAAAQTGVAGTNAANTAASAQTAAGNAQAASSNAIGGAIGNVGNNIAGVGLYRSGLYGNGVPGGGGGGSGNNDSPSGGDRFTQGNNIGNG